MKAILPRTAFLYRLLSPSLKRFFKNKKRRAQTGLALERVEALALFRCTSLAPDLPVPNAVFIALW